MQQSELSSLPNNVKNLWSKNIPKAHAEKRFRFISCLSDEFISRLPLFHSPKQFLIGVTELKFAVIKHSSGNSRLPRNFGFQPREKNS